MNVHWLKYCCKTSTIVANILNLFPILQRERTKFVLLYLWHLNETTISVNPGENRECYSIDMMQVQSLNFTTVC